jgi:DNA-binding NarL/FixJ family response regulator
VTGVTTVLICDDSRHVRDGLRSYVLAIPGVTRVETACSGEDVLARYAGIRPRLVLMDVNMPGIGGIEATRRLTRAFPDANVVVLTVAADRDAVTAAVSAGARGYLSKDVTREELSAAVAHAIAGGELAGLEARPVVPAPAPAVPLLTERELQVLRGMSQGKSNSAIGRDLYLSEDTVKTHARRLFRKLGVNDRAQAVARGFRWGLVR